MIFGSSGAETRKHSRLISNAPEDIGTNKKMRKRSHKESLIERLRKDPGYAVDYVNASLEDADDAGFLIALRNVAESRQMSKVAANAAVQRESLYRMLSEAGNPRLNSLMGVLKALGLRLSVTEPKGAPVGQVAAKYESPGPVA